MNKSRDRPYELDKIFFFFKAIKYSLKKIIRTVVLDEIILSKWDLLADPEVVRQS